MSHHPASGTGVPFVDHLGSDPVALLKKYDVAAPRYTSYPPVPYWGEVSPEDVQGWLAEPSTAREPSLSLYFHLPFCTERCTYCGCFVIITPHKEQGTRYVEAVKQEMRLVREQTRDSRPVRQLHLGGGTPTFISPDEMAGLIQTAVSEFPLAPNPEMSIEVDPRTVNQFYLTRLREMGFNRISLGVQDFDPKVMQAVNREQPFEMVQRTVEMARSLGYLSVNFDLIYGLPYQSEETFAQTLTQVEQLRPDRLAVYNYAHLPRINPYQRRLDPESLPGPEEKTAIFLLARQRLGSAGYVPIGLDHFSLPEDELTQAFQAGTMRRNFMGYSTQAGTDMLAFGISSISEFNRSFWQNEKKLNRYYESLDEGRLPVVKGMELNADDLLRKEVVSSLFCAGRLNFEDLSARHQVDFQQYFSRELEELKPLAADGMVEIGKGNLVVSQRGQLFLRNIAMLFDAYLQKGEGAGKQFSRAL